MTGTRLTPADANARLPFVSAVAADVADLAAQLAAAESTYRAEKQRPLPSQPILNDTSRELRRLRDGLASCRAEVASVGARLGDAPAGWVDFHGELDGTSVLYCWKFGEPRVEHFHGDGEDHRRRRPLPVLVNGAV